LTQDSVLKLVLLQKNKSLNKWSNNRCKDDSISFFVVKKERSYQHKKGKRLSLHTNQKVHKTGAYLRFRYHEATGWDASPSRVTPSIQLAGIHLYTWVERVTVRVKCLAQEHNRMSPARARTRTARSGIKRTNHEATAPLLSASTIAIQSYLPVQDSGSSFVSFARQATLFNHHQATTPFVNPLLGHIYRVVILELF